MEWIKVGGKFFNVFVDVVLISKWGSWGVLCSLNDINVWFEVLLVYNIFGVG